MLEIIGLILIGLVVGAFGTMVGIGGGPFIVPLLIVLYKFTPLDVVATSLTVVLFNVLTGTLYYANQKRIDIKSGTKFGIIAIPGAFIGTFLPQFFTARFFELTFSILLFILAINLLVPVLNEFFLKKYKKISFIESIKILGLNLQDKISIKKIPQRIIIDSQGNKYKYRVNEKLGLFFSGIIGFISPIIGIGGGVIHMPLMTKILNFPVHIAAATCHYILLLSLPFSLIPYIAMEAVQWSIAIPLGIGTLFGARIGSLLSIKYSGKVILGLLGCAVVLLAIRLLFVG